MPYMSATKRLLVLHHKVVYVFLCDHLGLRVERHYRLDYSKYGGLTIFVWITECENISCDWDFRNTLKNQVFWIIGEELLSFNHVRNWFEGHGWDLTGHNLPVCPKRYFLSSVSIPSATGVKAFIMKQVDWLPSSSHEVNAFLYFKYLLKKKKKLSVYKNGRIWRLVTSVWYLKYIWPYSCRFIVRPLIRENLNGIINSIKLHRSLSPHVEKIW